MKSEECEAAGYPKRGPRFVVMTDVCTDRHRYRPLINSKVNYYWIIGSKGLYRSIRSVPGEDRTSRKKTLPRVGTSLHYLDKK